MAAVQEGPRAPVALASMGQGWEAKRAAAEEPAQPTGSRGRPRRGGTSTPRPTHRPVPWHCLASSHQGARAGKRGPNLRDTLGVGGTELPRTEAIMR